MQMWCSNNHRNSLRYALVHIFSIIEYKLVKNVSVLVVSIETESDE